MSLAGPTHSPLPAEGGSSVGTMGPVSAFLRTQPCMGWVGVFLSPSMELMTFKYKRGMAAEGQPDCLEKIPLTPA